MSAPRARAFDFSRFTCSKGGGKCPVKKPFQRTVTKTAARFFPEYEVLTKDGRVNARATAATRQES